MPVGARCEWERIACPPLIALPGRETFEQALVSQTPEVPTLRLGFGLKNGSTTAHWASLRSMPYLCRYLSVITIV